MARNVREVVADHDDTDSDMSPGSRCTMVLTAKGLEKRARRTQATIFVEFVMFARDSGDDGDTPFSKEAHPPCFVQQSCAGSLCITPSEGKLSCLHVSVVRKSIRRLQAERTRI